LRTPLTKGELDGKNYLTLHIQKCRKSLKKIKEQAHESYERISENMDIRPRVKIKRFLRQVAKISGLNKEKDQELTDIRGSVLGRMLCLNYNVS
jgi:transcriptional antiterminator